MSKMDEQMILQESGLLKLLHVINEFSNEWTQEIDFKTFVVNKMRLFFDECGELECEKYFDIAFDYNFIKQIPVSKKSTKYRYILSNDHKVNAKHDWFCFDCDKLIDRKSKQFQKCENCWRVFHIWCSNRKPHEVIIVDKCGYCERLNADRVGFIGNQRVDIRRLNTLIEYLLDFVKEKMKSSYDKFVLKLDFKQSMVVFKEMDLSLMKQKAVMTQYQCLMELDNDFGLFMHNLNVTTFDFSQIGADFENLKEYYTKELKELRLCVDCYERSNNKDYQELNKDWFCEPCEPPHRLLFAKVKGFPYWPSKLVQVYDDDRYQVRFFDKGHKRMDVKASDTRPIDDLKIIDLSKKNSKLVEPMKMLEKYMNNLKEKKSNELKTNLTNEQKPDINEQLSSISLGQRCVQKHLNESIEQVVNAVYGTDHTKSPRIMKKRMSNSKKPLGVSLTSTSIKKTPKSKASSGLSELITTKKTQNPNESLGLSQFEFTVIKSLSFNSENDSNANRVPLIVVTDPSQMAPKQTIEINKKVGRRSKRKRVVSPKVAPVSAVNAVDEHISQENVNIPPDVPQIESQNERMDMQLSQEVNEEVIKTDVPLNSFKTSGGGSSTADNHQTKPITNSMSSQNYNLMSSQTGAQNNVNLQSNEIIVVPDSSSGVTETKDSLKSLCNGTDDKIKRNETIVPESTNNEFVESSKHINALFDELLKSSESSHLKQKIICIKYYHQILMEASEKKLKQSLEELKQSKEELVDCKEKFWCAICHNLAKFYCCVRFYCSRECQRNDWLEGHALECLTLNKTDKL